MARKSVEYNTDTMYNIIHIHRLLVEHRSYLDNLIYQYVHVCTITCNFDTKLSEIQHRSKRSNNYYILMTCTHWNTFKHIADKGTGWKVGAVKKNLPFKNIFDKSTSIVLFELSTGLLYQIWGTDVRKSWSLCHSGSRLIVSLVLNWYAVERLATVRPTRIAYFPRSPAGWSYRGKSQVTLHIPRCPHGLPVPAAVPNYRWFVLLTNTSYLP